MDTAGYHDFAILRTGAVTHTTNNDQRRIPLSVTGDDGSGSFTMTVPSNSNVVLPGTYFLFALNMDGVPSMGKTVYVADGTPMPSSAPIASGTPMPSSAPTPEPKEQIFFLNTGTNKDDPFITGNVLKTFSSPEGITGAGSYEEAPFQTNRWGRGGFVFTIGGLDPGVECSLTLGFAEIAVGKCQVGRRVMDILVNDDVFENNLDVFGRVGCHTALLLTRTFVASPGGELVIEFSATVDNPFVSLIEVTD